MSDADDDAVLCVVCWCVGSRGVVMKAMDENESGDISKEEFEKFALGNQDLVSSLEDLKGEYQSNLCFSFASCLSDNNTCAN